MVSPAPEDEWPREWLAQQQTAYVVTVDRRLSSPIALDPSSHLLQRGCALLLAHRP
jgi:hypothetical protein